MCACNNFFLRLNELNFLAPPFTFYRAFSSRACPAYSSLHLHNTFAASSATAATAAAAAAAAVAALTCIKLQRIVAEHNLCRHTTERGGEGQHSWLVDVAVVRNVAYA